MVTMTRQRDTYMEAAKQRDKKIMALQATCDKLGEQIDEQRLAHEEVTRNADLLQSELDAELSRYKAMVNSVDSGYIPRPIPSALTSQESESRIEPFDEIGKDKLYAKYRELVSASIVLMSSPSHKVTVC